MASTINASTVSGLITTADTSGQLELQTANTTRMTIDSSGNASFTGNISSTGTLSTSVGTLYPLVVETSKSASGTAPEYTGIPSWVDRITLMFNGVSTNSTGTPLLQLGSTTYTTSGYASGVALIKASTANNSLSASTTGFRLYTLGDWSATATLTGSIVMTRITGNTWTVSGTLVDTASALVFVSGSIALGGVLDRLRLYVDGTQTFDAGTINIMYE